MKSELDFTILTPVRNGMPWLPEAIRSIEAQGDQLAIEHIVYDAGSSDGSREWLTAHPSPSRTDVFASDRGQADALARGFASARGRYLGWLNSDDVLEPGALAIAASLFAPGVCAVSATSLVVDADGQLLTLMSNREGTTTTALLHRQGNLPQPATFFARDAYQQCGGMNPDLVYAMDVDLWLKLSKVGTIVLRPELIFSRFRVHPDAKTARNPRRMLWEDLQVRMNAGLSPWSVTALRIGLQILDLPKPSLALRRRARRTLTRLMPPL